MVDFVDRKELGCCRLWDVGDGGHGAEPQPSSVPGAQRGLLQL